jgi:hypothetical protein
MSVGVGCLDSSLLSAAKSSQRAASLCRMEAYWLADFEGRGRRWLGNFGRDYVEEELQQMRPELDYGV